MQPASGSSRLSVPEGFLAIDGILDLYLNVVDGLVVYPKVIEKHMMAELPFMATENIIMDAVKAGGDRQVQIQNTINCKEAFRNTQTLVRRIIQCTLKPLGRCNQHRVHHVCHHVVSQGSHTLASHRISLICHSGGTDLILLERLFYFFQMLKKTDIVGEDGL